MCRLFVRETIRSVLVGTSLAVFPAIPFYIYAFDATSRQVAILAPLFLPTLICMLGSDLLLIRFYLRPVPQVYRIGRRVQGAPNED